MFIGMIGLSAKPYHNAHDDIILQMSNDNDLAYVFISTKDRENISAETMKKVWKTLIIPTFPSNIRCMFVDVPISSVYNYAGDADKDINDINVYNVYGAEEDLNMRFKKASIEKYFPTLSKENRFNLVTVNTTISITGTKMREYVKNNDKQSFLKNIPNRINGEKYWQFVFRS